MIGHSCRFLFPRTGRIWVRSCYQYPPNAQPAAKQFGSLQTWHKTASRPSILSRCSSFQHPPTRLINTAPGQQLVTQPNSQISNDDDAEDRLYRMIEVEIRGHEEAVLNSYEWFLCRAAKELDIEVSRVYTPLRHYERFSVLKSAFIYKKHKVEYEFRTYYKVVQLRHLTGSTADTYLEYVQRNLPEGVFMKVLTCLIEELPEAIREELYPETDAAKS
ncbi:putative 28S ribosomal protein S10, mitochondrial [Hypsibius exemplaris]|uniref:Small ribosomal subunit protein uS10m n=1 Tax=Hypsibius exemplaris TaxID=2072580 RepID=A0A1W0XCU8_HYPEX|nr:putative 28S ribosomal protein S10, mitochondrial [Hypsibius exemplaris]